MKKNWLLFPLLLLSFLVYSQEDSLMMRIYLVGDAGKMENGHHPVLEDLSRRLLREDIPMTHILYLGDNIYPSGMPEVGKDGREEAALILEAQLRLSALLTGNIWMLPGNHDWARGKSRGWDALLNAQAYVRAHFKPDKVRWVPEDGCPGPLRIQLNQETLLIILDSQWWLHRREKPSGGSDCKYQSDSEILTAVSSLLESNPDKLVLFAMHHPLRSYGSHNGGYSWKDHIFPLTNVAPYLYIPLPVIGSIYPIYRTCFGSIQDIPHPRYQALISGLDRIFKRHQRVIHVAGHDHGLFYTDEEDVHYVVSGAGAKDTCVRRKNPAAFTFSDLGYAYLDFFEDRRAKLTFLSPGVLQPLYETDLFGTSAKDNVDQALTKRIVPNDSN